MNAEIEDDRSDEILKLALDFARESTSGIYPKLSNRAAHDLMTDRTAQRFGLDARLYKQSLSPPGLYARILKWYSDLVCPPIDSKNPKRLVELEDYLACPTPLADDFNSPDQQGLLCAKIAYAIEEETKWRRRPYLSAKQINEMGNLDPTLSELVSNIRVLFELEEKRILIALVGETSLDSELGSDSLGICFIPEDERKNIEPFLI